MTRISPKSSCCLVKMTLTYNDLLNLYNLSSGLKLELLEHMYRILFYFIKTAGVTVLLGSNNIKGILFNTDIKAVCCDACDSQPRAL